MQPAGWALMAALHPFKYPFGKRIVDSSFFFPGVGLCNRCEFPFVIWRKWIAISCDTIEAVRCREVIRRHCAMPKYTRMTFTFPCTWNTDHSARFMCQRDSHVRAFGALNHFRSIYATHTHTFIWLYSLRFRSLRHRRMDHGQLKVWWSRFMF